MLISDLYYELPEERIARHPTNSRDASKLLVYKNEGITDTFFNMLGEHLPHGATLVFNETRVIEARLAMLTEQAQALEMFLLKPAEGRSIEQTLQKTASAQYKVLVRPKKKWKEHVRAFADSHTAIDLKAIWINRDEDVVLLEWEPAELTLAQVTHQIGKIPLPPYLKREATHQDAKAYNSVFSKTQGAVAAPTASLHFTEELLRKLIKAGFHQIPVTLHVGAGTFLPVKTNIIEDHPMHGEFYGVQVSSLQAILNSEKLIPIGTTALRTLETLYWRGCHLLATGEDQPETPSFIYKSVAPFSRQAALQALLHYAEANGIERLTGSTSLFILPGYKPSVAAGLITNFHQPGSTLLALVEALVGRAWHNLYQHALENNYRFLSYGDASLLVF